MSFQTSLVLHCIRGVTAHKHDGSARNSVLTSRFSMVSVQQEEKRFDSIHYNWLNKWSLGEHKNITKPY